MRSWKTRPVPLSLVVVWTCYAVFIFAQLAQAVSPRTSNTFPLMMNASAALLTGFAMLVYYGMRVAWTRSLYLFLLSVGGGWLFFSIVYSLSGVFLLSAIGFVGLPVCLYISYWMISVQATENA